MVAEAGGGLAGADRGGGAVPWFRAVYGIWMGRRPRDTSQSRFLVLGDKSISYMLGCGHYESYSDQFIAI